MCLYADTIAVASTSPLRKSPRSQANCYPADVAGRATKLGVTWRAIATRVTAVPRAEGLLIAALVAMWVLGRRHDSRHDRDNRALPPKCAKRV